MVSTRDIAKKLNLSQQTVSYVLNGKAKSKRISEKTIERVTAAAGKMNYRRNKLVSAIFTGETKTVGLILPSLDHYFWPIVAQTVEQGLSEAGYRTILASSNNDPEKEKKFVDLLMEQRVDALAIGPIRTSKVKSNTKFYADFVKKENKPLVMINEYYEDLPVDYVATDNKLGTYLAAKHLLASGHKKICFIAGPLFFTTTKDRIEGYEKALKENKLKVTDNPIIGTDNFQKEDGYNAMKKILSSEIIPEAVLLGGDIMAMGAWIAINEEGLKVPEDIKIIGYGDALNRHLGIFEVPITTIRHPSHETGEKVVEIILSRLKGDRKINGKVILQPQLIFRESCGSNKKVK